MNVTVYYRKGGEDLSTLATNNDLELVVTERGGSKTVRVKAWADVVLRRVTEENVATVDARDTFLLNGYQSWTDTREFMLAETENNIYRLPKFLVNAFAFDRYGDATFYPYSKNKLHGYDVFYSRGGNECFFCNMNAANAYLVFEVDRASGRVDLFSDYENIPLRIGDELTVLSYRTAESYQAGMRLFCELFPRRNPEKIFGYTSWYHYYQNISEAQILRDLEAVDGRFNLFQIDDGYETFVGDWMSVDPKKFPNGLAPIVEKIHEKGLMAGIWLAPFVAEAKSEAYRRHPEWFRRGNDGKPVKCGSNWSGFYALDLDNEEVLSYIRSCLRRYTELGFDFFKLDFLYAANLPAYEGKTRAMSAEKAYAFLRETLGDRLILGCGATPFNCAGKFDYLRVGPDVSLKFDDVWFMRMMHRERVSTKVTLQNTIYRSFMNGRLFGNDPDVFILREKHVSLTEAQKEALLTINSLFGRVLMTSDFLADYNEKSRAWLQDALERFRTAEVTGFERDGDRIRIHYTDARGAQALVYDTEKGELV